MTYHASELDDRCWLPFAGTQRLAVIKLAKDIHVVKCQCCASGALEAEKVAIELVLQGLKKAIVGGAGRAEIIELLDT